LYITGTGVDGFEPDGYGRGLVWKPLGCAGIGFDISPHAVLYLIGPSVDLSVHLAINLAINQSINQSINQPINGIKMI